jgi:exosome complex component RRP4
MTDRQIVIPGEVIASGEDYLPGEWTEKIGDDVISVRFGLMEETNKLVRVIPLSGVYQPRRGNVVIGKVEMLTMNGWVIDIGTADNGFLPLMEVPRFVNKDAMDEVMDIGDMVVAKIWNMNKRGIDLSIKSRGYGRIEEGLIVKINPNKIPRVIGKEGSMISLIKSKTNCEITAGQNGLVWIQGNTVEEELFAKRAIEFIEQNSFMSGLTEEVEKWLEENKK